ncbi:hypothetical protein [Chengkuizengella sediminis]|uniref:hypothetical protein n=1 Tax=Chengkuizengella sediminis TaxID=1885917 RepID=UPI001389AE1B|nr:hypothetical protein [Chengkuizengella sediminis]NDI36892.1 hypothetical protein [Chengkuizengella sediminis]
MLSKYMAGMSVLLGIIFIKFAEGPIQSSFMKTGTMFIVAGVVIFIAPSILKMIKKMKMNHFLTNGKSIKADVEGVFINYSIKLKGYGAWNTSTGQSPYKIKAEWYNPMTNQTHTFTSENLWIHSTIDLPSQIDVYIDEHNPKKYYMDCRFLGDSALTMPKMGKSAIIPMIFLEYSSICTLNLHLRLEYEQNLKK